MGKRTDSKRRMVVAARQLIRERGYNATAMSDVLERSSTPRGSVYFHFPGGKVELMTEAVGAHVVDQLEQLDRLATGATTPADLVLGYVDLGQEGMVASDYGRGCAIAPIVTEAAAEPGLDVVGRNAFTAIVDRMAAHLRSLGLDGTASEVVALAAVAATEGALIVARSLRDPGAFDAVRATLATQLAEASGLPQAS